MGDLREKTGAYAGYFTIQDCPNPLIINGLVGTVLNGTRLRRHGVR